MNPIVPLVVLLLGATMVISALAGWRAGGKRVVIFGLGQVAFGAFWLLPPEVGTLRYVIAAAPVLALVAVAMMVDSQTRRDNWRRARAEMMLGAGIVASILAGQFAIDRASVLKAPAVALVTVLMIAFIGSILVKTVRALTAKTH